MTQTQLYTTIVILIILLAVLALVLFLSRNRRYDDDEDFEGMDGHDFEYYCADVLRDKGFRHVEVTKGSGDFGIDILAERNGVTYGVQCKNYDGAVGVHAVQEAYAGKDYYDRMVGAVMTNATYTRGAVQMAEKLNIILWDGRFLK